MASAPWLKFLEPGEQVLWSAATSLELRLKELGARRRASLLACAVATTLAVLLGWGPANTPGARPGWFMPDLSGYLLYWPLYIVGIAISVGVAATSLQYVFEAIAPDRVYAMTSARLLLIDDMGVIVDQTPSTDIKDVRMVERVTGPVLEVRRAGRGALVVKNVSDMKTLEGILWSGLRRAAV